MLLGVELWVLLLILGTALVSGVIHGAVGLAGGLLMATVISHFMPIQAAVTVVTSALLFSHTSRAFMLRQDIDWWTVRHVLLFGTPTIVLGSVIFGYSSQTVIANVFGVVLGLSLPIKYWAKRHAIKTGPKLLAFVSSIWGLIAGHVIGPGFLLTPFLLSTGMNRLTFVGTLAIITLSMNTIKLSVFGATELVTSDLIVLGLLAGIATIPSNMLGRAILRRMTDGVHARLIDVLTLLLVANFFYLAVVG